MNRQSAEIGMDIGLERRRPLRCMLSITPAGLVRGDEGLRALPKSHHLGAFGPLCCAARPSVVDWVDSFLDHPAKVTGSITRFGQADVMIRSDTPSAKWGFASFRIRP